MLSHCPASFPPRDGGHFLIITPSDGHLDWRIILGRDFMGVVSLKDKEILLIDDDTGFLYLTSLHFKKAGARVFTARDGLEGIDHFFAHQPDLVILDVTLPGFDGFEICTRIRQISDAPIIMLSALDHAKDVVRGLDAGADDFLSKPLNPAILLARAATILRRFEHAHTQTDLLHYDDGVLSVNLKRQEVLIRGKRIKLKPIEFRLLAFLVRNGGKILTSEQILVNVWGERYRGNTNYVHVRISYLRNKIEEVPRKSRYVITIHGVGYMFDGQSAPREPALGSHTRGR